MRNFRLSVAQVKFHEICPLIGSFYWKYVKFQLKKYRGVMSHDTVRVMQNFKKNRFVPKMTRIWWILIRATILQNLLCDFSLLCKVYNIWPKKLQRNYLKSHAKFEEKLACGLENDTRNLANFHLTFMGSFCPK